MHPPVLTPKTYAPCSSLSFCRPSTTDKIGEALKAVLQQASSQGRVTCSLTSCVDLLSTRPDDVMLCVMPVLSHPDASATIQSTLIRAVCQEHCIRVLSVDCDVKLAKAVCMSQEKTEEEVAGAVDDNCSVATKAPPPSAAFSEDSLLISDCDNMAPVMGFPCALVQVCTGLVSEIIYIYIYIYMCVCVFK